MGNFQDLIRRSMDAMFAIDPDQRVILWNRASEDLTGISAAEAVGCLCHDLMKGQDPTGRPLCKAGCCISKLAGGGAPPASLSMRITSGGGKRIQLNVGTLLAPSNQENQWMVVHVMSSGRVAAPARSIGSDHLSGEHPYKLNGHPDPVPYSPGISLLTQREKEILRLLTHGLATETISSHLHISIATVRNHIQRLMAKLNVRSRLEAVTWAHHHRLA
jgi:PAS domain S-box-containing protein